MKKRQTSRRKFLKIGTGVAFTILGGKSLLAYTLSKSLHIERATIGPRNNFRVFSEGRIANLRLKNRLVKAATVYGVAPECEFSDSGIAIYKALSEGGVGLIISGAMIITQRVFMMIGLCPQLIKLPMQYIKYKMNAK